MSLYGTFVRVSAVAIVTGALGMPLAAQSPAQISAPPAPHKSTAVVSAAPPKVNIFNFGQINPNYYRGAQPERAGMTELKALGVKTVIDLRNDDDVDQEEPALASGAGINYIRIPMSTRETPTPEKVSEFLKLVNDPAHQPVYVHCVEGRHRTGVMTAVYRMTQDSWTADKAFKEMKQFRFGFDFLHPEFKRFVYSFKPLTIGPAAPAAIAIGTD